MRPLDEGRITQKFPSKHLTKPITQDISKAALGFLKMYISITRQIGCAHQLKLIKRRVNCRSLRWLHFLPFIATIFASFSSAYSATFVWTNAAGGNWSNSTNWSPNQVPGQLNSISSLDDILISNLNAYTVTFDVGDTTNFWGVHSITVAGMFPGFGPILSIPNGTILQASAININNGGGFQNFHSGVHGMITIGTGAQLNTRVGVYYDPLTIAGTASVNGDFFYQSMTVNKGATLTMLSDTGLAGPLTMNGKFNIQSGTLNLLGPMTNSGTITFFDTSYGGNGISLYNDGTTNNQGGLINLSGGVINLNNAIYHGIVGDFGHEYFINQGVLTCTNSGMVNVATFDNSAGVVTNWSGELVLGQFTNGFAGFFYAAAGAPIEFTGGTSIAPITPGNALSLNGNGPYQFFGGHLLLTNNLIPDLQLSWGILELGPDFQGGAITNLTFDSMWLTNETLPITGTMTVNGSTAQVIGDFTIASGGLLNANNGTFHGRITVATNGTMTSGSETIANDASLTVNGTLNVIARTQLFGPLTNANTINLTGSIFIFNGTNFFNQTNNGALVNQSGGVINILTNGAIITGGNREFLVNNGRIIKSGDTNTASINITGFTNSGSITAQQGMLQLNHITLLPTGSLNVSLNSKSDYGKIGISGAAALTGAFGATLANNYVPNPGDSFQPLTYGFFTGNLIATNLPPLVPWQTTYGSTALTLLVTQTGLIPAFATFASANGQMVFSGTNGIPHNAYWILAGTNVAQLLASWKPVATNKFDSNGDFSFTNAPDFTKSQQFFILELQ